ncbi:MAG: DoxX family membrane protein [Saprospiraceae bacterium]|nr:DoxX family membrane protein [Saprospiraceae bacterium]
MTFSTQTNRAIGIFLLRTLLGLIFLMQGYGKVFTWGISNVYENVFSSYEETWLPGFLLQFTAYFTSYMELIGGLLLVLGLFRHWAYIGLGAVLLLVSYGHGLSSPIWDLQHVFVRAVFLIGLLLVPNDWDQLHLDRIVVKTRQANS